MPCTCLPTRPPTQQGSQLRGHAGMWSLRDPSRGTCRAGRPARTAPSSEQSLLGAEGAGLTGASLREQNEPAGPHWQEHPSTGEL